MRATKTKFVYTVGQGVGSVALPAVAMATGGESIQPPLFTLSYIIFSNITFNKTSKYFPR